jgi:predicted amino acid-binding ACT domain protein
MAEHNYYMVYGTGNDSVGLVGSITLAIAEINGNIVDMRQDVMHGLFTIFLVVDLSKSSVSLDEFKKLIDKISLKTSLKLFMDKYYPVPRDSDKNNVLLILLGADRPGIIASISETLGKYKINIEFSQNIAREGIFLMELLVDISSCTLPLANLQGELTKLMQAVKITTLFQTDDVFNKKKRVILFNIFNSFIDNEILMEILKQARLKAKDFESVYTKDIQQSIKASASLIHELPYDILKNIIQSSRPRPSTIELIQTLKIMGYKIVLVSSALSFFTDYLKKALDIDYSYGFPLILDNDTQSIIGDLNLVAYNLAMESLNKNKIIDEIMHRESVGKDDITIIEDKDYPSAPGFGIDFDMKLILDYYNQHVLSGDKLTGILGSFGIPKL